MSVVEEIKSLDAHHFGAYSILFMSVFAPGLLLLLLYKPHLVEALSATKLFALSIAFSLPIPALNTLILGSTIEKDDSMELIDLVIISALLSSLVMYITLMASYLWAISFRNFIFAITGIECAIILMAIVGHIHTSRKAKK